MKKRKLGAAALFCVGMLSLASCTQPQTSYGAPNSESDSGCYDSMNDEPQDVYGPPVAEDTSDETEGTKKPKEFENIMTDTAAPEKDAKETSETTASDTEQPSMNGTVPDGYFRHPQVVYGPPSVFDETKPAH